MSDPIAIRIAPVRRRMALRRTLTAAARGAVGGAWLAVIAAIVGLLAVNLYAFMAGGALFFATLFVFIIKAWRASPTTLDAARRVDAHYSLQDRTVSALQLARGGGDPFVELQRNEAIERLSQLAPAAVMPIKVPLMDIAKAVLLLLLTAFLAAGTLWRSGREVASLSAKPAAIMLDVAPFSRPRQPPISVSPQAAEASLAAQAEFSAGEGAESSGWNSFIDQPELAHRYFDRIAPPQK